MVLAITLNCLGPAIAHKVNDDTGPRIVASVIAIDLIATLSLIVVGILGAVSVLHLPPAASYSLIGAGVFIAASLIGSMKMGPIDCISKPIRKHLSKN